MHPQLQSLICEAMRDSQTKYVLADWLEENGDEQDQRRAALLRLEAAIESEPADILSLHTQYTQAWQAWRDHAHSGRCHTAALPDQAEGRWLAVPTISVPLSDGVAMRLAWVPPGSSWLGGGGGELGKQQFTLRHGLWCGLYPVTQAQWQVIMGNNSSRFGGNPDYPVKMVSWDRTRKFIQAINEQRRDSELEFRLPSEEEWEYLCRGGPLSQEQSKYHFYFARSQTDLTSTPSNDLSSDQANFDGNYPAGKAAKGPYLGCTSKVGLYLPNPLGIYDLHGNVWELTSSQEGSTRVIRGGSWYNYADYCMASSRSWIDPGNANNGLGCRLLAVPVGLKSK